MRLRNPGGIEEAIQTVGQVQSELGNTVSGLLNREWKTWDSRLSQVIDELRKACVFTAHPGRIVMPDTSALMEGILFTEYDWHALDASLGSGPVRIVVPVLVVEELDGHIHSRDRHRKTATKEVLRLLWALHRKAPTEPAPLPQAADVTIEVLIDSDLHQRRENNDGEIIDQALSIQELAGQPVILATCDYNQAYRAAVPSLMTALVPRRDEQEHPESPCSLSLVDAETPSAQGPREWGLAPGWLRRARAFPPLSPARFWVSTP
jgi:hypothetical protein